MREFASAASKISLNLLLDDEQAPMLADCVRLGKVGRATLLGWKREHEELMARAAEGKAKTTTAGGAREGTPTRKDKGEGARVDEEPGAGPDVSSGVKSVIHVRTPTELPQKGKGKGKAPAEHPDMGEPVSFLLFSLPCAY